MINLIKYSKTSILSNEIYIFPGIFIIASPSFVIGNEAMPIPVGPTARAFCFLIQRNFFVWVLAKISVFIVMCMAVERWYALVRPIRYKVVFTLPRVTLYVTTVSSIVLIVTIPALFQTFAETKGAQTVCVDKPLMGSILASQLFTVLYCTITAFIPFMVIIATFIHLQFHVMGNKSLPQTHAQKRRQQVEIMLARMSAIVALVLMICIFPSQITFILFSFSLTNWDVVNVASTLSMFNSVFNPWIYCFTNKVYRKEFAKLFRLACTNQRETSASSACYERRETASISL